MRHPHLTPKPQQTCHSNLQLRLKRINLRKGIPPPPKRESHSPKHRRDEREREGKERRDNREYRAHADPRELRPLNRAPRD